MSKVIYIAGFGRSGSTLLERVLGSHEKIFATGELFSLLYLGDSNSKFSYLNQQVKNSDFWSAVLQDVSKDIAPSSQLTKIQRDFESLHGILGYIVSQKAEKKAIYKHFIHNVINAINHNSSKNNDYIVDSSKTTRLTFFRPIALAKIAQCEVKVIHLVRDGRGCIWSVLKGSNIKMEQGLDPHVPLAGLRCALSWLIAQTAAHIFQQISAPDNYIRVRYEDFVTQPEQTLKRLSQFLSVDFENQIDIIQNKKDIPLAHQLTGNRVRNKAKIAIKMDNEWKTNLSWYHRILFWILDWPYALLYGYNKLDD